MIFDATAVVGFFKQETGDDTVAEAIAAGAAVCTANLAETAAVLVREGMPFDEVTALIERLPVTVHDVDLFVALGAARLYPHVKQFGLSLANRLCLVPAERDNRPALTGDRIWLEARG